MFVPGIVPAVAGRWVVHVEQFPLQRAFLLVGTRGIESAERPWFAASCFQRVGDKRWLNACLPRADRSQITINQDLTSAFQAYKEERAGQIHTYDFKWWQRVHDSAMSNAIFVQACTDRRLG